MGKFIFWDLDGVLRDLSGAVFQNPADKWNYHENGKDIYDLVDENPFVLITAKPLPYLKTALKSPFITILTCQPKQWRYNTEQWIKKHLSSIDYEIIYTFNPEQKIKIIEQADGYLIDDYPLFSDYSRIIVIDKPYNRGVKALFRARNCIQLEKILKLIQSI